MKVPSVCGWPSEFFRFPASCFHPAGREHTSSKRAQRQEVGHPTVAALVHHNSAIAMTLAMFDASGDITASVFLCTGNQHTANTQTANAQ